jgi:Cysteine rich repeat
MKDHMRKFVLALALLSSTTAAFAQQQQIQGRPGTAEEQAACNRDVQRHCRSVINQGDFVILACLQQNRAQISAACNQVLKNHGQ